MRKRNIAPYLFILPVCLFLLLFSYLPMPYGWYLSVFKAELGTGKLIFTGLDNYKFILTDPNFWESFRNTFEYTFLSTAFLIILGLITALILDKKIRFSSTYLTIMFVPWIISDVVTGITWSWLLDPSFGVLNYFLKPFGIKASNLLTDPKMVMVGLALVAVWKFLAYVTILLLAGLQNVSKSFIEAAKIDGANWWQILTHITFPILKNSLFVITFIVMINCMNQIGIILLLTNGGPGRASETLGVYMYREAFMNYRFTDAAAISVVLAVINMVVAGVYLNGKKIIDKFGY